MSEENWPMPGFKKVEGTSLDAYIIGGLESIQLNNIFNNLNKQNVRKIRHALLPCQYSALEVLACNSMFNAALSILFKDYKEPIAFEYTTYRGPVCYRMNTHILAQAVFSNKPLSIPNYNTSDEKVENLPGNLIMMNVEEGQEMPIWEIEEINSVAFVLTAVKIGVNV